ncbi:MAG TPA: hypothetical protein DCE56_17600 [Cyanobacteria bacterium UBA8553]|nr:hypothetical protein [Cyanobacteria bacterium UBA8553]HAJ64078.1 hypothetical protein [Cyanobacteria bacterium UBA8543]
MDVELIKIKEYASKMALMFADKASKGVQTDCYIRHSIERQAFWRNIAQLPPDSEYWKHVKKYFRLMSDSQATQSEIRTLYHFLREKFSS